MTTRRLHLLSATAIATLLLTTAACGGSDPSATSSTSSSSPGSGGATPVPAENNPPGDIPDNLAFVAYTNDAGHYTFTHPEGWVRTVDGPTVTFTDKLNGVMVSSKSGSSAPTVASAKQSEVARIKADAPAFKLQDVEAAALPAGKGVHIVYRRNSDPDPVTGKVYRDEVEEYLVFSGGRLIQMDLFGPVGADNVDAYRTMSQSLKVR